MSIKGLFDTIGDVWSRRSEQGGLLPIDPLL